MNKYEELKRSIASKGQQEPILVHPDGTLLDGALRLKACQELGIEPSKEVRHL